MAYSVEDGDVSSCFSLACISIVPPYGTCQMLVKILSNPSFLLLLGGTLKAHFQPPGTTYSYTLTSPPVCSLPFQIPLKIKRYF